VDKSTVGCMLIEGSDVGLFIFTEGTWLTEGRSVYTYQSLASDCYNSWLLNNLFLFFHQSGPESFPLSAPVVVEDYFDQE